MGKWKDWFLRKERGSWKCGILAKERRFWRWGKRIWNKRNQLSVPVWLIPFISLDGLCHLRQVSDLSCLSFLICHTWIIIALVLPASLRSSGRNWTCFVNLKVWLHKRDYYLVIRGIIRPCSCPNSFHCSQRDKATHETIRELCKMVSNNCRIVWWSLYGGKDLEVYSWKPSRK